MTNRNRSITLQPNYCDTSQVVPNRVNECVANSRNATQPSVALQGHPCPVELHNKLSLI